jgi:hypothetical protein
MGKCCSHESKLQTDLDFSPLSKDKFKFKELIGGNSYCRVSKAIHLTSRKKLAVKQFSIKCIYEQRAAISVANEFKFLSQY